uniref:DUF421 domain-containing protein n=1 Tax=Hominenteromicrobium sp. TaxID=3073581 RepID=UPI003AB84F64
IEVREVFNITKVGLVAGAMVKTGKVKRSDKARLIRYGIVIFTGAGKPVVIIKDGRIIQENMQELRMSVEDLFEQLRQKDVFVLSDVTYAIVETNGTLSVVKKAAVDYLRPSDMGVKVKDEGLEVVVVSDGDLSVGSMHLCGKNEEWIHSILKSEAVPLPEVFILTVNTAGHYTLIRRDGSLKKGVKK